MSRHVLKTTAFLLLAGMVSIANAQGFTLNPFKKKEPQPDTVRRNVSDATSTDTSRSLLPKLRMPSLPKPTLPKPTLPKLSMPKMSLPGLGGDAESRRSQKPAGSSALTRFNQGAKDLFGKTTNFVTAPFRSQEGSSSRTRMASSSRSSQKKSWFTFPWANSDSEPPPKPRNVNDFLAQPRPGFNE